MARHLPDNLGSWQVTVGGLPPRPSPRDYGYVHQAFPSPRGGEWRQQWGGREGRGGWAGIPEVREWTAEYLFLGGYGRWNRW